MFNIFIPNNNTSLIRNMSKYRNREIQLFFTGLYNARIMNTNRVNVLYNIF